MVLAYSSDNLLNEADFLRACSLRAALRAAAGDARRLLRVQRPAAAGAQRHQNPGIVLGEAESAPSRAM